MERDQRPPEAPEKERQHTDQGALAFLKGLVSDWHPLGTEWQLTITQRLWVVRITIVLIFLVAIGYAYDKTLWSWMKLLIVPAVLAAGGYLFTRAENRRTQRIAHQRAQDEALQAYLGAMGSLMLDKGLGSSQEHAAGEPQDNSQVPTLARARTLTVVRMLGPDGKRSVLDFLYESKLIGKGSGPGIIDLGGIDRFGGAANLSGANLEADHLALADLSGANLTGANLREANLGAANLRDAYLSDADLGSANLLAASLEGAKLAKANLSDADLGNANLWNAELTGAKLANANLINAKLHEAKGVTNEELEQTAKSLQNAILPNGQKYEDWLKSREEDGKDSAHS